MHVWNLGPDRLMVSGTFSDFAVHHHPAVQVAVGTTGPLTVIDTDGERTECRLVVVASGTRHSVRSDAGSAALSIYLGPATREGIALNALTRNVTQDGGIWTVPAGERLADAVAEAVTTSGPRVAADFLVNELCNSSDARHECGPSVHPQVHQAIDLISSTVPAAIDLASVADAVAISPDYLGRLFKRHTGASFSASTRWARLLTAMRYLVDGMPVTDAAHLAGFADGSHANRVCWEMVGANPSDLLPAIAPSPATVPPPTPGGG
ncbi:helix-turn-helix transcriptional regulator [Mycobacterium sp. 663a-19]|nr:helix-turn-helix transcriptional regulator [Mycobacterium sp. 663a-19]